MFHDTFGMFANYNGWANKRLYAAAHDLTDEELRADRGAFFRSMLGTLNHLLATDRIWMKRLTGQGDAPTRLDAILFEELAPLEEARLAEDARIAAWLAGMDDDALTSTFTYRTITNPKDITQPYAATLFHLFNHQTHHRGQAHAILTGLGRDAPSFDMVLFQRETGLA